MEGWKVFEIALDQAAKSSSSASATWAGSSVYSTSPSPLPVTVFVISMISAVGWSSAGWSGDLNSSV